MSTSTTVERPRPAARIDPRIRARRITVARTQGRRRLQRLSEAGALTVVLLAFAVALRTPLLDVDRVQVAGAGHTPSEAIRAAVGVERGTQLIDVDVADAAARVAALPGVDEATVSRRVGGTLEVVVTERVPVAQVQAGTATLLVDAEGRLLGPVSVAPDAAGLVALRGVEAVLAPGDHLPAAVEPALRVALALADRVPGAVAALELRSAPGVAGAPEIDARLAQGGVVRFGDASQLDAKLLSLLTMLDQVDLRQLALLDLRLPGNPVLTREPA